MTPRWMHTVLVPMVVAMAVLVAGASLAGCGDDEETEGYAAERRRRVEAEVQKKYGKSLDELETLELVAVCPHPPETEEEYEKAFDLYYAQTHGKRVDIVWRDMGGGSTMVDNLRRTYESAETSEIDIFWGGGSAYHVRLAEEGVLQPVKLPEDVRAQIPATFGGVRMYDPQYRWVGTAVSGFGFLYNRTLLERLGKVEPPKTWNDLGAGRFHGLLALANPNESSSAASAYEMIVQSGKDWPNGWAKLLSILGNAKKFYSGAGDAADAVKTEVPVATCIDFYGIERVNMYPDALVYVSPPGQTAFTPDPISILKNPPHADLAQAFVEFVLSPKGQALWALPVGAEDGPVHNPLNRTPIRKDVFTAYQGKLMPGISSPFGAGGEMRYDQEMHETRSSVLKTLVRAAAIDNTDGLKKAKKRLIDSGFDSDLVARFNELPEDVRTREQVLEVAEKLKDETEAERITTRWRDSFRAKYGRIAE